MITFPRAPKLVTVGIGLVDEENPAVLKVILLQHNLDPLRRMDMGMLVLET